MSEEKQIKPIYTKRIDFVGIALRFERIKTLATSSRTKGEFKNILAPLIDEIIKSYWHLLSDGNYIEGEMCGLLVFLSDKMSDLLPKRFNSRVIIDGNGNIIFELLPMSQTIH